MRRKCVV
jgi:hypothetical protein